MASSFCCVNDWEDVDFDADENRRMREDADGVWRLGKRLAVVVTKACADMDGCNRKICSSNMALIERSRRFMIDQKRYGTIEKSVVMVHRSLNDCHINDVAQNF